MKFCAVLYSLLLIPASAQAATISGFVTDRDSGEYLLAANVFLSGTSLGALSNDNGFYAITGIPEGSYVLVVSYIGYETYRDTLSIGPEAYLRRDVELVPTLLIGETAVVEADRNRDERLAQPGFVALQAAVLKELPAIGETDLLRSLQLLPGIQASSDISSGLYVRGGGPDQTQILLDQIPLYNPSHAFGFFSIFNPEAIKDMRLHKSAYPAHYGGALGAVLDVTNRDGNRNDYAGSGGISLISARTMIEGPLASGSFMVSGRRTYLEPILAYIRSRVEDIPGYYFYDVNAKINQNLSYSDNLVLSGYFGRDDLNLETSEDDLFNVRWGNSAVTGKWTHLFSPTLFGNFMVSGSDYASRLSANFDGTEILFRNSIRDISVKGDLDYVAGGEHAVKGGFRATAYRFRFTRSFNQDDQLDLRQQPYVISVYAQDQWQARTYTSLRLGLRANYYSERETIDLEPRMSISHRLSDGLRLKAGGGRYHQYLQLITTEGFSGGDFWVPLDGSVDPGQAWHFVIGASWDPAPSYRLSLESYYQRLGNLVVVDNTRAVGGDETRSEDVFITGGKGYATGVEAFVERLSGRLTGWIGYTLGWTRRQFPEVNQGNWYPPKYDRRHDLVISANYRAGRWSFGGNVIFATGQAFTPASARYELRESARTGIREDYFLPADRNASRLLPYHRMDLSVKQDFRLFDRDFQWYLQVFNAYNHRNEWFVQYDTEDEEVTTAEVVKMLPIVPTIGLNYNF